MLEHDVIAEVVLIEHGVAWELHEQPALVALFIFLAMGCGVSYAELESTRAAVARLCGLPSQCWQHLRTLERQRYNRLRDELQRLEQSRADGLESVVVASNAACCTSVVEEAGTTAELGSRADEAEERRQEAQKQRDAARKRKQKLEELKARHAARNGASAAAGGLVAASKLPPPSPASKLALLRAESAHVGSAPEESFVPNDIDDLFGLGLAIPRALFGRAAPRPPRRQAQQHAVASLATQHPNTKTVKVWDRLSRI